MSMDEGLSIWTIYDHPKDYPHCFVARRHVTMAGVSMATPDVIEATNLHLLRDVFFSRGLTPIMRSEGDDPVIIESWF